MSNESKRGVIVTALTRYGMVTGALLAVMAVTGCADVQGKWVSVALEPRMASDQFVLLRPRGYEGDFLRATLDLREDKTYTAEVFYAGDMGFSNGGWSVLGDRLRLVDNKYGTHTYRIDVHAGGRTMSIIQPIKGTDVRLVMRREQALLPTLVREKSNAPGRR